VSSVYYFQGHGVNLTRNRYFEALNGSEGFKVSQTVCLFALCNRHWFNKVPGPVTSLGIACLPFALTLTLATDSVHYTLDCSQLRYTPRSTACARGDGSVGAGMVFWGVVLLFILGSNLGGIGPDRGLRGGGRRGWCD
jgi:hypothetical protein